MPLFNSLLFDIQFVFGVTVLMTCYYLTLENNENLEQTETCHLDIHVHCQIDVILNASCCISASYEKTSVSNNNYQ